MDRLGLRITEPARRDLVQILGLSAQAWGDDQADRYEADLYEAFDLVRQFPDLGTERPHLFLGSRAYPVGSHAVYYQIIEQDIVIVRILHQRQDPNLQCDDPDHPTKPGHQ
jgi:toxin ParE1/3/4